MSGRASSALPTVKNVPLTPCASRMARTTGVYVMLGPSSKVIATSRRSRGPWLTSDPNQPAVGELAPIQPVNPTTKIEVADATSRPDERALGRAARATEDAATADTTAHAVPTASADARPPAARATTIATAATAAEAAVAPPGRSRRGSVIPSPRPSASAIHHIIAPSGVCVKSHADTATTDAPSGAAASRVCRRVADAPRPASPIATATVRRSPAVAPARSRTAGRSSVAKPAPAPRPRRDGTVTRARATIALDPMLRPDSASGPAERPSTRRARAGSGPRPRFDPLVETPVRRRPRGGLGARARPDPRTPRLRLARHGQQLRARLVRQRTAQPGTHAAFPHARHRAR